MPSAPGKGGAMPKRSSERMGHRSKEEKASVEKLQVSGTVEQPLPSDDWHDIARNWYVSLASSGQAIFYEPSDWAAAHYLADVMTRNLTGGRFSAQLFSAVWAAMNDLMTTEGSRRRLRLELERVNNGKAASDKAQAASVLNEYRNTIAA